MSSEATGNTINLKVLTPEGAILEGEVFEVTLPGSEGEIGILPEHTAVLTRLSPGRLSYRAPDGDDTVALGGGVVEVYQNGVTVLVDSAVLKEDIDIPALEEKRKQLLDTIDKESHEDKIAELESQLTLADVQLRVARSEE